MKKTALIMAGGRGERFWPESRANMPKQFLSLTGDGKTMIQLTVERIQSLVDIEDIFIATNESYRSIVRTQLPEIPEENIICEPIGRNTAPCIGLGAVHIAHKYEDALMFVFPSDHMIKYTSIFCQTLLDACEVAEKADALVTLGITPNEPETGYGYIKFDPDRTVGRAYAVEQFVEKPDLETAKIYLASREFLWNSGMFIWKVSSILNSLQLYLPEIYNGLKKIGNAIGTNEQEEVLDREFRAFKSVSIDYGIMEKASNIYCLAGNFGWDDVGSWLAVSRIQKTNEFGNLVKGNVVTIETTNSIVLGKEKLIATVGLKDIVIVDTEDVILICEKESAGKIKKVLENLRICNKYQYL